MGAGVVAGGAAGFYVLEAECMALGGMKQGSCVGETAGGGGGGWMRMRIGMWIGVGIWMGIGRAGGGLRREWWWRSRRGGWDDFG